MKSIKEFSYHLVTRNKLGNLLFHSSANRLFPGSAAYWEKRYRKNGNSGAGSYGEKALYKAAFLNKFVAEKEVKSVVELGCGDGNQVSYFRFPLYTGMDVSETAIKKCLERFEGDSLKSFFVFDGKQQTSAWKAELVLSLDVIYHLVEDEVYERYMNSLFQMASKYVIVYGWDVQEKRKYHVRHRRFSNWAQQNVPDFKLIDRIIQYPYCDFFIYKRIELLNEE